METRQELIERVEARRVLGERQAEPNALRLHKRLEEWVADVEDQKKKSAALKAVEDMPDIGGDPHRYLKEFSKVAGSVSMVLSQRKAAEVCSYLILLEQLDKV